ncbi:hypothetical protein ACSSLO_07670, partial [Escherichia coli]
MKLLTTAALVASLCIISAPPVLAENIVGSVRTWKSMQADGWKSADGYDDNHMHNALYQAVGNDSNLLIVFYVQIMPDDFVM